LARQSFQESTFCFGFARRKLTFCLATQERAELRNRSSARLLRSTISMTPTAINGVAQHFRLDCPSPEKPEAADVRAEAHHSFDTFPFLQ